MRILLVSHLYPPRHTAGTEVYTAELAARLSAAGHEVEVFTSEKDIGRPDGRIDIRVENGVRVHELVSNLYLEDFDETWFRPAIDQLFARLLERVRPDLVHVHHLMYLSAGLLEQVRARGLPLVFTLHDFWLACPRFGQLVHADGGSCATVDPRRCGSCLPSFRWRQSTTQRRVGRAIAGVHRWTRLDLGPLARRFGRRRAALATEGPPAEREDTAWTLRAERRAQALRESATTCVDRFIAPSEFLRDWFVRWGLAPERVLQLSTGVDRTAFGGARRTRRRDAGEPLRVAFLGTLVPIKGAHVLLDAWARLPDALRAKGRLRLFGPGEHAPAYQRSLEERAAHAGAELCGPLARDAVPAMLAATDVLVVPSVWFENRPLVVLEALATGTPLLVSEPGGMAELVRPGVDGERFAMGDAAALAERLADWLARPEELERYGREAPELPTWEALTAEHLRLYGQLIDEADARRARE